MPYKDKFYHSASSFTTNSIETAARFFIPVSDINRVNTLYDMGTIDLPLSVYDHVSGYFNFDFIINRVQERFLEFDKVVPYVGETFSHTFYGKSPVYHDIQGILLETKDNNAKHNFLTAYINIFKLSQVAKNGVAPVLYFNDTFTTGAFTSLNFSEDSQNSEAISTQISFLVLDSFYYSGESQGAVHQLDVNYSKMTTFGDTTFNPN
jgi:hypothetical protein